MSGGSLDASPLPAASGIASPAGPSARWLTLARRARLLSWFSLAWMTAEGAIAIAAGIVAGSIALIGFGIDSAIEGLASVIIIWRFTGSRVFSEHAERRGAEARRGPVLSACSLCWD